MNRKVLVLVSYLLYVLCLSPIAYGGKVEFSIDGYADAAYEVRSPESGFSVGDFSPILQFSYGDKILFQGNPIFTLAPDTTTRTNMNYLTFNMILNDSLTLTVGQFLSPLGQFRQYLRSAWINKLPNEPLGFSDTRSVAPTRHIGAKVHGSHYLGRYPTKVNYSLFVSNGPELINQIGEILVNSEEVNGQLKKSKMVGTRIGISPVPELDFHVSGAYTKTGMGGAANRVYYLTGSDFVYHAMFSVLHGLELRGEYIRSYVELTEFSSRTEYAWFAQISYEIGDFQPVIRYSTVNSKTKNNESTVSGSQQSFLNDAWQKEHSIGINYIIYPSVIAKFAFNHIMIEDTESQNVYVSQIVFGF